MSHPGWYLLAYDIAHPRRLQRLHRAVRREAITVQRSVFLVYGTQDDIEALLDRLAILMNPREDDLRAYPVDAPAALKLSGQGVIQGALLGDGTPVTTTPAAVSTRLNTAAGQATPRVMVTRIVP